jgi:putative CocE/NonD family hydrolase
MRHRIKFDSGRHASRKRNAYLTASLALLTATGVFAQSASKSAGQYVVPPEVFSDWTRSSQYVSVRDGTKLALDIYRPAVAGKPVSTPHPVILEATPYHRVQQTNGQITASNLKNWLPLLKRGYVVVTLDIRGRGASFGTVYAGGFDQEATRWDLWDIIEWLAQQPWSNGNIGMGGCSYVGLTQMWAAETMPPHLKTIAPCSAPSMDSHSQNLRANGVSLRQIIETWDRSMYENDIAQAGPPVDEDMGGEMLKAAVAQHRISWDRGTASWAPARLERPFRDSVPKTPEFAHLAGELWNYLPNFRLSKLPVLQFTGWRDPNLEQALALYQSLRSIGVAQRLVIGPWYHCAWYESQLFDSVGEQIRWYEHWLTGKDNGLSAAAPVSYYVQGAPRGQEWRTSTRWPLPNQTSQKLTLTSIRGGKDQYVVNYSAAANLATRFHFPAGDVVDPGLKPIDTDLLDSQSAIYTGNRLDRDVELIGTPIVNLWASSTAADQDFFVYLEDVDAHGHSTLLTEGAIRASNRAIRDPGFDNNNLPWHPSLKDDQAALLPGHPALLTFALNAMSNRVQRGHCLRIAINSFDAAGGWDTPTLDPAPVATIFHDAEHPSTISVPLIAATPGTLQKSPRMYGHESACR